MFPLMYEKILFLDIETISNPGMIQYIPEPEAPSNYKDVIKIASYKEEAKAKIIEKMALDIDYAQIRAIGIAQDYNAPMTRLVHNIEEEKETLKWFWDNAYEYFRFCGYNIRGFDLPIIIRRSWILCVIPSKNFNLGRGSKEIVDLMQLFYHEGYAPGSQKYRSFKNVCKMYGINNFLPDIDGSMVSSMTDEELIAYNTNDIRMTQELAKKTEGYYWGELPNYNSLTEVII